MKLSFALTSALIALFSFFACSKEDKKTEAAATPAPSTCDTVTYANTVGAILTDKCSRCHTGGEYDFSTSAGSIKSAAKAAAQVAAGKMPDGDSTFKDTDNGKIVIAWGSCASPK